MAGAEKSELEAIPFEEVLSFAPDASQRVEKLARYYQLASEGFRRRITGLLHRNAPEFFNEWVRLVGLHRGGRTLSRIAAREATYGRKLDNAFQFDPGYLAQVMRKYYANDGVARLRIDKTFVDRMYENGIVSNQAGPEGDWRVAHRVLEQMWDEFPRDELVLYVAALQVIVPGWFAEKAATEGAPTDGEPQAAGRAEGGRAEESVPAPAPAVEVQEVEESRAEESGIPAPAPTPEVQEVEAAPAEESGTPSPVVDAMQVEEAPAEEESGTPAPAPVEDAMQVEEAPAEEESGTPAPVPVEDGMQVEEAPAEEESGTPAPAAEAQGIQESRAEGERGTPAPAAETRELEESRAEERAVPEPVDEVPASRTRQTLRDLLRILEGELGIGPLREAARDAGLLGKEAKKAEGAALERLVADSDRLAGLVGDAFEDEARQASATRLLQQLATRAASSPTLDPRAPLLFRRASRGVTFGDWDEVDRVLGRLEALGAETGDPLLAAAELIVVLCSGDRSRVAVALAAERETPGAAGVRTATEGDPEAEEAAKLEAPATSRPEAEAALAAASGPDALAAAYRDYVVERAAGLKEALQPVLVEELDGRVRGLRKQVRAFEERLAAPIVSADELELQAGALAATLTETAKVALQIEADGRELVESLTRELGALPAVELSPAAAGRTLRTLGEQVERVERETLDAIGRAVELFGSGVPLPPLPEAPSLSEVAGILREHEAEAREALARAAAPQPEPAAAAAAPPAEETGDARVGFGSGAVPPGLLSRGTVGLLAKELARQVAPEGRGFAPIELQSPPVLWTPRPGAAPAEALNLEAANLLGLWAFACGPDSPARGLFQLLEPLGEANRIREAAGADPAAAAFEMLATALALHSAAPDRARSRGVRRAAALLAARSAEEREALLCDCAMAACEAPGLVRICCELVAAGLAAPLALAVRDAARAQPAQARRMVDAIAIAVALVPEPRARQGRQAVFEALELAEADLDAVEDYLADSRKQSRRAARPELPRLVSAQPLITDFVAALGTRLWERGRAAQGEARVGASVPRAAENGLQLVAGARQLEVPILIRNGGDLAAGGIVVSVGATSRSDPLVKPVREELHIPWLSDSTLADTASVVLACPLQLHEGGAREGEVRLQVKASWFGGAREETYAVRVSPEERSRPVELSPVPGYDGRVMDLRDPRVLLFSSGSVQGCYRALHAKLRAGRPARAVIFGRRRRGKSSICEALSSDEEISKAFAVRYSVWNGPRMASVAVGFATLSKLLVDALAQLGIDARVPDYGDLVSVEELSERFLHWFDGVERGLESPAKVLLILDEFQKWIMGLALRPERVALLSALRHFNDRRGKLEVSIVLSGLRNLKALIQESADLANAVDQYEIRELTHEEADRYLRERVEIELDGRSRRRLMALCGGNPYVLNRLLGNLVEELEDRRRAWCTSADVEALLRTDDAQTGRLAEFVRYMLHEDEDDTAPTLRQLTVLRAVASILAERGDYQGYVRWTDVEAWLGRAEVPFEPGEPQRQIEELVQFGHLQPGSGGRYFLHGEWLCRQLAALDPGRVRLQPVTRDADPELVLGRYRKLQLIDRGGEAEIWRAENVQEGGREVVLRIYPANTAGLHERLEREKSVLSKLQHPNVVGFLGANVDERHGGVIVLDFIKGQRVDEVLEKRPEQAGPILPGGDLAQQVRLLVKIAGAVRACHAVGIVHKDLAPRNVMLTHRLGVWEPTLIDFGIAGFDTQPVEEGRTSALGTPGYVAPEKTRLPGTRRTAAADVFSLGALFLRLLTDEEPGPLAASPKRLAEALEQRGLPARLRELVSRMVEEDPGARPTAAEVVHLLGAALTPLDWREMKAQATEASLEERAEDALALFGDAVGAVPLAERDGAEYLDLLCLALEVLRTQAERPVAWVEPLVGQSLDALSKGASRPSAGELLETLALYCDRFHDEAPALLLFLARRIGEISTRPELLPLVMLIAQGKHFRQEAISTTTFEVLALYYAESGLQPEVVEDFCVQCAKRARAQSQQLQQLLQAELWLQRVGRLGGARSREYEEEAERLREARESSGRAQVLPPTEPQERMRLGEDEKGHLKVQRLEQLDRRLRRLFPFIVQLKRVTKDRFARAARPTLLGVEHVGRHLPAGGQDPGNLLPLLLDGSYTAEGIVLRMNIVLSSGTSASQREAALDVLRDADEIFDCAG